MLVGELWLLLLTDRPTSILAIFRQTLPYYWTTIHYSSKARTHYIYFTYTCILLSSLTGQCWSLHISHGDFFYSTGNLLQKKITWRILTKCIAVKDPRIRYGCRLAYQYLLCKVLKQISAKKFAKINFCCLVILLQELFISNKYINIDHYATLLSFISNILFSHFPPSETPQLLGGIWQFSRNYQKSHQHTKSVFVTHTSL